ncbi:MAG: hypothetical protein ACYC6V_09940 [Bacillota bacterium]
MLVLVTLAFIGLFLVGLLLVEKGADLFGDAVGDLAEHTGASPTVVGLITAGTEWEELVVAVVAAASGATGLAIGDIVGSNIANLTSSFSLGLLVRPLEPGPDDRRFAWGAVGVTVVAAAFMATGLINRWMGGILVLFFAGYLGTLWRLLTRGQLQVRFEREED